MLAPSESLSRFVQAFFEGAGPTLTTLLNRPVAVAVREVVQLSPTEAVERSRCRVSSWRRATSGGSRAATGSPSA